MPRALPTQLELTAKGVAEKAKQEFLRYATTRRLPTVMALLELSEDGRVDVHYNDLKKSVRKPRNLRNTVLMLVADDYIRPIGVTHSDSTNSRYYMTQIGARHLGFVSSMMQHLYGINPKVWRNYKPILG